MTNVINNQNEVIKNIEQAILKSTSSDEVRILERAKLEAIKCLTTLKYVNQ